VFFLLGLCWQAHGEEILVKCPACSLYHVTSTAQEDLEWCPSERTAIYDTAGHYVSPYADFICMVYYTCSRGHHFAQKEMPLQ
jgi:hypothetical protein